jgi:hypothetical protein
MILGSIPKIVNGERGFIEIMLGGGLTHNDHNYFVKNLFLSNYQQRRCFRIFRYGERAKRLKAHYEILE